MASFAQSGSVLALEVVAGGEDHRGGDAAQRQRQFEIGGGGKGRRDARHDLVGNAGVTQRLHLFAGAAEHQRIAGLQPNHALALAAKPDQQRVDLGLALGVAALALADRQAFRVAAAHGDDRLRHQRVMDDHVGFHQQAVGAQRQQVFRARAGADQRDVAASRARCAGQQIGCGARAPRRIADLHGAGRRAGEEIVPEAAALTALRQQPFGRVAQAVRQRRQAARATATAAGRSWRARSAPAPGPAPSVPMAMASGARLTSAGVKKSQSSGRSTAFTGMPSGARVHRRSCGRGFVAGGGKDQRRAGKMVRLIGGVDMLGAVGGDPCAQAPARAPARRCAAWRSTGRAAAPWRGLRRHRRR